jgi:hypothetical protein
MRCCNIEEVQVDLLWGTQNKKVADCLLGGNRLAKVDSMANPYRRNARSLKGESSADPGGPLPRRWVLIIAVAVSAGLLVGRLAGIEAGFTVGIAVAAFLHRIMD